MSRLLFSLLLFMLIAPALRAAPVPDLPAEELAEILLDNNPCKECAPRSCPAPDYASKIKAQMKVEAAAEGVPSRLLGLYDQLPDCLYCLEAGAALKMDWVIDEDKYRETFGKKPCNTYNAQIWTPGTESHVRDLMKKGVVKSFRVFLLKTPCRCCPEGKGKAIVEIWREEFGPGNQEVVEATANYNEVVGETFTSPDELGPEPEDLKKFREEAQNTIPVDTKPALREAHPACAECQGAVGAYNTAFGQWRDSFDRIIALQQSINDLSRKISDLSKKLVTEEHFSDKKCDDEAAGDKEGDDYNALERATRERGAKERDLAGRVKARAGLQAAMDKQAAAMNACHKNCDPRKQAEQDKPLEEFSCEGVAPPEKIVNTCAPCQSLVEPHYELAKEYVCYNRKFLQESNAYQQRSARLKQDKSGDANTKPLSEAEYQKRLAILKQHNARFLELGRKRGVALKSMLDANADYLNCVVEQCPQSPPMIFIPRR